MKISTTTHKPQASPTTLIIVLCLGGLLASYMQTLVVPISGRLPGYLHTSADNASWIITATLLAAAVTMPIAGRLADMFGKRRVILVSLSLLVLGSVVCATFTGLLPMIVGRTLQGLAMGIIPVGISLLRDELPPSRVAGAVATMSATLGVGGAIGQPIAAYIAEHYNWHLLFWTAAIPAAITFVLVFALVRESPARSGGTFDAVGAIGLSAALICLLLAVSKGHTWGWTSTTTIGLAVAGAVVLAVWVVHQLKVTSPMVNIRVACMPRVALTNLTSVLVGFALMGITLAAPQLLQIPHIPGVLDYGMGRSILEAGLWMAPGGIMMMLLSPVSAHLNISIGPKLTLMIGTAVIGAGYLFGIFETNHPWEIAVAVMIVSSGVGIAYSAMPSLIMSSVPLAETASANGLNSLMRTLGTSISSALLATILASSTVSVAGRSVPDHSAFRMVFIIGAIAAILALVVIAFIPKDPTPEAVTHAVVDPPVKGSFDDESLAQEIDEGLVRPNGVPTRG